MAIRITQAGVALTVGIIIITGLIVGGFFWVKNTGEQARREDAIKIAEQNLRDQSDTNVALNDGEASENSNNTASDEGATKADNKTSENAGTTETNSDTSSQAVTELPQTGPADQLATILSAGVLTFAVVSYVSSRQQFGNGFSVGSK